MSSTFVSHVIAKVMAIRPEDWSNSMPFDPELLLLRGALLRQARIDGFAAILERIKVLDAMPVLLDMVTDYSMVAWDSVWDILAYQEFDRVAYDFIIVGRVLAGSFVDVTLEDLIAKCVGWNAFCAVESYEALRPPSRYGRDGEGPILIHNLPEQLRLKAEVFFPGSGSFEAQVLSELGKYLRNCDSPEL